MLAVTDEPLTTEPAPRASRGKPPIVSAYLGCLGRGIALSCGEGEVLNLSVDEVQMVDAGRWPAVSGGECWSRYPCLLELSPVASGPFRV